MENSYDGGGGVGATTEAACCCCRCCWWPATAASDDDDDDAAIGVAVCRTGFCTCVLLTDCIMMGDLVLVCLDDHACMEPEALEMELDVLEANEGDGEVQQCCCCCCCCCCNSNGCCCC